MNVQGGDHICGLYSTTIELADTVGSFLADGLRRGEQCWYVASGNETDAIRAALGRHGIDVSSETGRAALRLVSADDAYLVHGEFDPELTVRIFNDAIEQAYADGFSGFRAAADMSWALVGEEAGYHVIEYEALLRSLFASCRAIGLCLYDRERMPLAVINGALATHPVASVGGQCDANPFYDSTIDRLAPVADGDVIAKMERLKSLGDSGR